MSDIKQIVLIVLDGWGHREEKEHNAIFEAPTPFFDSLYQKYPHTLLEASGLGVGLPDGEIGSSEVGHMSMGVGRVLDTDVVRISKAMEEEQLQHNEAIKELFEHVIKNNSTLHIQGLISPGSVHSHSSHLYALLKEAKKVGIEKIAIHAFTDGRDTLPKSGAAYIKELEDVIEEVGIGFIATATGRFWAMDRDNNWDRIEKAEKALFEGEGRKVSGKKPSQMLAELYEEGLVDEHIEPVIFLDDNGKSFNISDNDGVLFFNFRADRAKQISSRILEYGKDKNILFVTFTQYDKNFDCLVAFPPLSIETTLGNEISKAGLTQAHIAETEKYAHVTYFFNGGKDTPYVGEEDILIPSRKDIQTHDLAPEMRAKEIADATIEQLKKGTNFIVINFANADMVGHTANKEAIVKALECVDIQLKRVIEQANQSNAIVIVTADHGNAELNIDHSSGEKHTAHTNNRVPFIVTKPDLLLINGGSLSNIAATVLELLNIQKPEFMTSKSLILNHER